MEIRHHSPAGGAPEYHVAGELWRLARGRIPHGKIAPATLARIDELWESLARDGWRGSDPFQCVLVRRAGRVFMGSIRQGRKRLAALKRHHAPEMRVPCVVEWRR